MESWENGRGRLLDEVARLYDNIGTNIQSELDEVNTVRIWRSQLTTLEEQAARADAIEKDRARLAEELEQAKSAIEKVDILEQNNKELRQQLEILLQQNHNHTVSRNNVSPARGLDPGPASSAIPPPATIPAPNEELKVHTKTVPGEVFNHLAKKYNDLVENWRYEKKKKEEHVIKYQKSKEVVGQWQSLAERRAKQVEQRDGVIESLKRRLDQYVNFEDVKGTRQVLRPVGSMSGRSMGEHQLGHVDLSSSAPPAVGRPHDDPFAVSLRSLVSKTTEAELPKTIADASSRPVPSLSTTTTMDIPSDPPVFQHHDGLSDPVQHKTSPRMVVNDSQDENESESPLLLPTLPVSKSLLPESGQHGATDKESAEVLEGLLAENYIPEQRLVQGSDSPEVVSVRRLKKRKGTKGSPTKSPRKRIKIEITSSPSGLSRVVNSSDSLDLDDIGQKTDTPKKQRRLFDLARGRRALSDDTDSQRTESQRRESNRLRAVSEQIAQETPIRQIKSGRKNSALQPKSVNKQVFPRLTGDKSATSRRMISDRDIGNLIEGGEVPVAVLEAGSNPPDMDGKLEQLLHQISPTKAILSPVRLSASNHRSPPKSKSNASRLSIFQDRNTDERNEKNPLSVALTKNDISTEVSPLLIGASHLRNTPGLTTPRAATDVSVPNDDTPRMTLSKQPTTWNLPSVPRTAQLDSGKIRAPIPEFVTGNATKVTPRSTTKTVRKAPSRPSRSAQTEEDWEHDPDQEPLRLRPVESLRLEDFKVNPNYNQGYDFAFREVVRDKDARQELQGCMKPGCCLEKFRAMAVAQRNPNIPPTAAQQEADEELLEEYMGDNVYKLRSMDQVEKNEVLLQARIRKIANQHGRHRHAYERPSTPPGFWRADFATTQEEAADKAQAEEDYKVQVRQRYEDAMRGSGRYLFKDE